MAALLDAAGGNSAPADPSMPGGLALPPLKFVRVNTPSVTTPWEMRCHLDYLAGHLPVWSPARDVLGRMDRFVSVWHTAWAQFGDREEGRATYRHLIEIARADLQAIGAGAIRLTNNVPFAYALDALIFANAVTRISADQGAAEPAPVALAS